MISACHKRCLETVQLSDKLIDVAKNAYEDCDDDDCLVLFGIVLDSVSRLRLETEKRLEEMKSIGPRQVSKVEAKGVGSKGS